MESLRFFLAESLSSRLRERDSVSNNKLNKQLKKVAAVDF